MLDDTKQLFRTVDTGEAYQPIRLTFTIGELQLLKQQLGALQCLTLVSPGTWSWLWRAETAEIPFASVADFSANAAMPVQLGTLVITDELMYLNLTSFKRACLAIPFFHQQLTPDAAVLHHADFINKVFGIDEPIIDELSNLFSEQELQIVLAEKLSAYQDMQEYCEQAKDVSEALAIIKQFAELEASKPLAFVERYLFNFSAADDPSLIFLSFYVFIRSRELAAIKRWLGATNYSLADAVDETMQQIFGNVGVDLVD
jgi:hypothetical protein